jgi:hypothetical protein
MWWSSNELKGIKTPINYVIKYRKRMLVCSNIKLFDLYKCFMTYFRLVKTFLFTYIFIFPYVFMTFW